MIESLLLFLPIALILALGTFVQAAAGFAAGMLIVPALLWMGYTIPAAQTALLIATLPQNVGGVWSLRDELSVKLIAVPCLGRFVFFPIGIWLLSELETLSPETIRQIVGVFILVATLCTIAFHPQPKPKLHPAWSWIVFPLSGFFQGLVGMGGPAMVLWVQAHNWNTRKSRGFLFAMYLTSFIPSLLVLYYMFGARIVPPALAAAVSAPLMIVVTMWGLKVGSWLGRERLRAVTLTLLLIISLSSIAAPYLH
ncbi:Sulfite exporter TauE/SafE [Rubripirellula amarantea]|uniref:Probable membrane transporter protein n=1 Tax=Rubripirellula amarantea TaxID=2527999 RepID=A0A5C5WP64_9BACT|nr:sulfite exporter TauE/SafE family protein [Rubripirellula amarantea]TWT52624.1 Sulfite exporter TauE/SafE [Rubripirellula amarantea]